MQWLDVGLYIEIRELRISCTRAYGKPAIKESVL